MSEVQPADAYDDSEFPLESSFAKFVAEDQPRFPFSADLFENWSNDRLGDDDVMSLKLSFLPPCSL